MRRFTGLALRATASQIDRERAQEVIERLRALELDEPVDLEQAERIACLFGGDVDLCRALVAGDVIALPTNGELPDWHRQLRQAHAHGEAFSRFLAHPREALAEKIRAGEPGESLLLPGGERISRVPGPEDTRPLYRTRVGGKEVWAASPEDLLDTLGFPPEPPEPG